MRVWMPGCVNAPMQVIVSPLVRLTNASDPPLEDVGTPAGLLNSLGSYITGGRHWLLKYHVVASVTALPVP